MFGWPSGLRQQTVNLPREISTSVGSNPTPNAEFKSDKDFNKLIKRLKEYKKHLTNLFENIKVLN